jgi:SAM-dependent methyltransferase
MTHPDRLAAVAVLHGMDPAPVDHCRVLEIGCSDGGNVLPMAAGLPSSRFLGIDLSPRQIEMGNKSVAELGLKNVELRELSILDMTQADGPFDYIITHGVASWVAEPVRKRLFEVLSACLSPRGVAYVSYNTYPGWHTNRTLREMMLYHCRNTSDPQERAERALELVRVLGRSIGEQDVLLSPLLREMNRIVDGSTYPLPYLYHEYLEGSNEPWYVSGFVRQAGLVGLQYLADADPTIYAESRMPSALAGTLKQWTSDPVEFEQYLDFFHVRSFRRSLLCSGQAVLTQTVSALAMERLHVAAALAPAPAKGGDGAAAPLARFCLPSGRTFGTDHPLTAALLGELARAWPCTLPFDRLRDLTDAVEASRGAAARTTSALRDELAAILLSLFHEGIVDIRASAVTCASSPAETPCVTPFNRLMAAQGRLLANAYHHAVDIDADSARRMAPILDGKHDRAALAAELERGVRDGEITLEHEGKPVTVSRSTRPIMLGLVDEHLKRLARCALLVG